MPAMYHVGSRGFVGYEAPLLNPLGQTVRTVIPAMALVDSAGNDMGTAASPLSTAVGPSSASAAAITPVVTTTSSGLLVKNSAGNFYGASVVNNLASAVAGYLIAYNAAGIPAAGNNLTQAQILAVKAVAAGADGSIDPATVPDRFSNGIVILFSTALATYTVPAVLPAFLKGRGV